jgi:hypothetical protein
LLYELRIYHCAPKKLPDLINRFETYTLPLWQKHGIKQAGFWTVYIGPSNHDLYYMLQWESLEERQKKWDAFMSDPDWIAKRAKTEEAGPIVAYLESMILTPTAFSAVK